MKKLRPNSLSSLAGSLNHLMLSNNELLEVLIIVIIIIVTVTIKTIDKVTLSDHIGSYSRLPPAKGA